MNYLLLLEGGFLEQYSWLLYVVMFIALIYFMMIRPNKKRFDEQKRVVDSLAPGVRVMLSSGIIGTVRAVGDAQLVVELAPGVEVTALKQVVVKVLGPDDEEFEYSDSTLDADTDGDTDTEPDTATDTNPEISPAADASEGTLSED